MKRVQVKSSTNMLESGAYAVELRSRVADSKKSGVVRRRASSDNCDMLFVATPKGNFLLEAADIPKSISFGNGGKWDKYIAV